MPAELTDPANTMETFILTMCPRIVTLCQTVKASILQTISNCHFFLVIVLLRLIVNLSNVQRLANNFATRFCSIQKDAALNSLSASNVKARCRGERIEFEKPVSTHYPRFAHTEKIGSSIASKSNTCRV
jgi:hypothetical protein